MCEPGDSCLSNYPAELIPGPHKNGEFKIADVDLPERERLELLRIRNSIESKVDGLVKSRKIELLPQYIAVAKSILQLHIAVINFSADFLRDRQS